MDAPGSTTTAASKTTPRQEVMDAGQVFIQAKYCAPVVQETGQGLALKGFDPFVECNSEDWHTLWDRRGKDHMQLKKENIEKEIPCLMSWRQFSSFIEIRR
eukprot:13454363-Alexandrium_andersonii.AAC.1